METMSVDVAPRAPVLRAMIRIASRRREPPLVSALLSGARRRALEEVLRGSRAEACALAPQLSKGTPEARAALAALAERASLELRERVRAEARGHPLRQLLLKVDRLWHDPCATEYMDDASLEEATRERIMHDLHRFNQATEAYAAFFSALQPFLQPGGAPTHVLDLASGHGGLALAMAREARAGGVALEVTCSDLRPSYFARARRDAEAEGLQVHFCEQNALDLGNLVDGGYDIVTCTLALHHFSAGQVAVMFHEACRVARRGVVFIDGCRSSGMVPVVASFALFHRTSWGWFHDAVISARRFFVPEELDLLARLGPWGDGLEADMLTPGHCLLRQRTDLTAARVH